MRGQWAFIQIWDEDSEITIHTDEEIKAGKDQYKLKGKWLSSLLDSKDFEKEFVYFVQKVFKNDVRRFSKLWNELNKERGVER